MILPEPKTAENAACRVDRKRTGSRGGFEVCVAAIAEADCVRRGGHAERARREAGREVVIAVERGGLAGAVKRDLNRFSGRSFLAARVGVQMAGDRGRG